MVRLRVVNTITDEQCCDLPGDQIEIAKKLADTLARNTNQAHQVIQSAVVYKTKLEMKDGAKQEDT